MFKHTSTHSHWSQHTILSLEIHLLFTSHVIDISLISYILMFLELIMHVDVPLSSINILAQHGMI
jgi:hypothetical protein